MSRDLLPDFRPTAAAAADRLAADPDHAAIEWHGVSLSARQLLGWSGHIAASLRADGLARGDRVVIASGKSPALVAASLGVLAAGGVMVPLDPELPPERRSAMLERSGAKRVIAVGDDRLAGARPGLELDDLPGGAYDEELRAEPMEPLDPAYIFFTSGSTGVPKGVLGTQVGLASFLDWMRQTFAVNRGDRVSFIRSPSFDASLREMFLPLVSGATMVIAPEPIDPDDAIAWIGRSRVTILNATPSHTAVWLEAISDPIETSLRWTCFSGEHLEPAIVRDFRRSVSNPGQIANLYGPTETTMIRTWDVVAADPGDAPLSVGHALPYTRIHVLDENGAPAEVGTPGEVVIATDVGTLGYLDTYEDSPFIEDPGGEYEGAYRTGDRGWLAADGRLTISGRLDDQVQILGVRIEPGEVAAALSTAPGVERVAVIAVPDSRTGHHLTAFVRVRPGSVPDESAWIAHLRDRVLGPAIPRRFSVVDSFPITSNGKIDKKALLEQVDDATAADAVSKLAGKTESADSEAALTGLNPAQRQALANKLRERLAADAPGFTPDRIDRVPDHQKRDLAARLRERLGVASPAVAVRRAPLSFAQERLWFLDKLFPGRSNYHIPRTHHLRGPLDADALRGAVDLIQARHEVLRTGYTEADGEAIQVVYAPAPAIFDVLDISNLEHDENTIQRAVADFSGKPFDLESGPAWRTQLILLSEREHILTVVTHHIASDGWSMPPLYNELAIAYAALVNGEPVSLPPLPVQYAEYAKRQRQTHEDGGFEDDLAYWESELSGAPEVITMPGSRPRPPTPSHDGARIRFQFEHASSERLRQLAVDHTATPFMIGLALFQGYLSRLTGESDLVVGIPSADRVSGDLHQSIGFFVNSLAMRAHIQADMTFHELAKRVRNSSVRSYDRREVPFEHVVRRLSPTRSTDRTPIFQVFYQFGLGEFNAPLSLQDVESERIVQDAARAKFDLTFYLGLRDGCLVGSAVYSTDLFDEPTMQRIVDGFGAFCSAALTDPHQLLAKLPINATGARPLERGATLAQPPPTSAQRRPGVGHEENGRRIAEIWEALLGKPVGLDDNFFELGGHSLLAIRAFSRIEVALGVEVPIGSIFEEPTPRGLASVIAAMTPSDDLGTETTDGSPGAASLGTLIGGTEGPLSYAQRRLWFLHKLHPDTDSYHIRWRWRLRGDIDLDALSSALDLVAARHAVFRTRFESNDSGMPRQVIDVPVAVPLPLEDLSELADAERKEQLRTRLHLEAAEPFDLTAGPILRARVFRLGAEDHVVSIVSHHIITDAESSRILRRELSEAYAAARENRPPALPHLPVQFVDVARRQIERFETGNDDRVEAWVAQLRGAVPVIALPSSRVRPHTLEATAQSIRRRLHGDAVARLRALGVAERASPFMVALAAFGVLIHRHAMEDDFLIGIPSTERTDPDVEHLIGYFVNTLPIRIDVRNRPSLRQLVAEVRDRVLFAMDHTDVPLEAIVDRMEVPRDASRTPLFQIVFDMNQAKGTHVDLLGLEQVSIGVGSGLRQAKFDLRVHCRLDGEEMAVAFEYRTDVVDRESVIALAEQYLELIETATANPDLAVDEIAFDTAAGRAFRVKDQEFESDPYEALVARFDRISDRHRDDVAIEDGIRSTTYGDLEDASHDLDDRLRAAGAAPGRTVGVSIERSASLVTALLGIVRSGAAYVPLDPTYPLARREAIADDAAISAMVTADPSSPYGVHVEPRAGGQEVLEPMADITYVMYTSGSTGTPKGVVVGAPSIWRLTVDPDYVSFRRGDVVAMVSNTSFDASTFEIWGALLNGARLRIMSRDTALAPERLVSEIRSAGVTTMFVTAALFKAIIAERPDAFASVRHLLTGGETADVVAMRRCLAAGPPEHLLNVYGPTETTTFATAFEVSSLADDALAVPIGRPIRGTGVRITDKEGRDAPLGVAGELRILGPGLAVGYLGDDSLTESRFVTGPTGVREYRTGDRVRRRSDGHIEFLGRTDRQLKIRGFRIEPGEIETRLKQHAAVREAAVLPLAAADGVRLAAYVVADAEMVTPFDLMDHLGAHLPAFMIPSAFSYLDTLPMTPNGKLDIDALPTPVPRAASFVAPVTRDQQRLARLWESVLEVQQVGLDDDFFGLGGHSLLAIRLFADIEVEFGRAEPLSTLFEAPTLRAMAARIANDDSVQQTPPDDIVIIRPGGSLTPVFCMPPAGGSVMVYDPMARAFEGERTIYGIQAPGIDGVREPLRTIEELAEHCEQVVVAAHPGGPYVLVGYSMGGLVAWEVARRLRATGHTVDLVCLVDAQIPRKRSTLDKFRTDIRIIRRHKGEGARVLGRRWTRTARSLAGSVRHGPAAALARMRGQKLSPLQAGRRLTAAGMEASYAFEPRPYAGPVTYFRARHASGPWTRSGVGRWRAVADGGLDVVDLAGIHKGDGSVMHEPHAAELANEIRKLLGHGERQ